MHYFSKWAEAYTLPNKKAAIIADVMVKKWLYRSGVLLELHSVQEQNFESVLFQSSGFIFSLYNGFWNDYLMKAIIIQRNIFNIGSRPGKYIVFFRDYHRAFH